MYRHQAESIKETTEKKFISQADKDKYDGYNFASKEDVYNRTEIDELSKNLKPSEVIYTGNSIATCSYSKRGTISNFELHGNTIQSTTDVSDIKHIGEKVENGYSIKVKTVGKNLFNVNEFYDHIKDINGVSRDERGIIIDTSVSGSVCNDIKNAFELKGVFKKGSRYVLATKQLLVGGSIQPVFLFKYTDGTTSYYNGTDNNKISYNDLTKEIESIIFVWYTQANADIDIIENVALYEIDENFDESTLEYLDYEEVITDFILNEPLRKIDNAVDKIVVKDNKLSVVRNVKVKKLYEDFEYHSTPEYYANNEFQSFENVVKFCIYLNKEVSYVIDFPKYKCFSNIIPYVDNKSSGDYEHVFVERCGYVKYAVFFISKSKIEASEGDTLSNKVRNYLKETKAELYYMAYEPQEYVKGDVTGLKSFNGATNILSGTDIEFSEINAKISSNVADLLSYSNDKLRVMRNIVKNTMEGVKEETLSKEVCIGDSFEANRGYISDIEIKGKTVFDLASKLTSCRTGSTFNIPSLNITMTERTCVMKASEAITISDWAYVAFDGLNDTILKPSTNYKITLDFNTDFYIRKPNISFRKSDSTVINSETKKPNRYGRVSCIIRTNDVIDPEGCSLFLGFDNCSFSANEKVEINIVSIIECDDEDYEIMASDNYPNLINVGGNGIIEIVNQSSNLISFDECTPGIHNYPVNYTTDLYINREILEVDVVSDNEVIVKNTSTSESIVDAFFMGNPHINVIKPLVLGQKYRLSWDCEVLEGDIDTVNSSVYIITTLTKFSNEGFRANAVNVNPTSRKYLDFICDATEDKNSLLFRINVNSPGHKIRFYNIKITPINNTSGEIGVYESDNVVIDLSKYGITNGLKSLPDGTCDRIYKRNGKYYLEQNVGEYTFDGNNDYQLMDVTENARVRMFVQTNDIFKGNTWDGDYTFNSANIANNTTFGTSDKQLPNSDLSNVITNDFMAIDYLGNTILSLGYDKVTSVEEYKQYLQSNPITIYGQLKNPITIELEENLDIATYNGYNTLVVINQGVCPVVSFKLPGNINNTIEILEEKVKKLQDNELKLDTLMLKSIYSGDLSKFDLTISLNARTTTQVDYDLYELLLKVIKGKSCELTMIEEMLDFFYMTDKLSYDMVEELFAYLYEIYDLN